MSTQPLIDPDTGKRMKRPASVYTVMLGVTVLVLIVCCAILYYEWKSYDFETRARLSLLPLPGTWNPLPGTWNFAVCTRIPCLPTITC